MLKKVHCIALIILALQCLHKPCNGARILISSPYGTKSFHNMVVTLSQQLAKRDHEVTLITNYRSDALDTTPGVNQLVLDELRLVLSDYPNVFEAMFALKYRLLSMARMYIGIFWNPLDVAEKFYANPQIQELIKEVKDNKTYDAVLVMQTYNAASYPLAWHFRAPLIIMTPNVLWPGLARTVGDNDHAEYLPMFLTSFTDHMNLLQRTINTITTALFDNFVHRWFWNAIHSIASEYVGKELPPLEELEKNVSLIMTNTHPIITYPRVLLPHVVEIGCLHCRLPKPLTPELEQFISTGKGFVIFAVGTTLPMSEMPDWILKIFIGAFSRIDHQVIWQWKGEVKQKLPSNVLTVSWLPQQDLLGHELCRGFITHGGLSSLEEATYHGVPLIGLPFGTDQKLNMNRAARDGYGVKVDWLDISEDTLTEALETILKNPSFGVRAKKRSQIFRDQLQTPLERAVFSVEHVIRHNGTQHLRLGSTDLPLYQRALIDVYIVIFLSCALPLVALLFCVNKCLQKRKQQAAKSPGTKKKAKIQ